MGVGWRQTFCFFKFVDTNMIYSLGIDIYMNREYLQNKSLMGFKILRSWRSGIFFQNHSR